MDLDPKLRNLVGDIALEAAFCGKHWEDLPAHINQLRQAGLTAAREARELSRLLAAARATENPYPADERPSELLNRAIDDWRHTRMGGGDPGDIGTYVADWLRRWGLDIRATQETDD